MKIENIAAFARGLNKTTWNAMFGDGEWNPDTPPEVIEMIAEAKVRLMAHLDQVWTDLNGTEREVLVAARSGDIRFGTHHLVDLGLIDEVNAPMATWYGWAVLRRYEEKS